MLAPFWHTGTPGQANMPHAAETHAKMQPGFQQITRLQMSTASCHIKKCKSRQISTSGTEWYEYKDIKMKFHA